MNARLIWASFWGELNTPGAFHDDPYGGLTNQLGHVALGAAAVSLICMAWAAVMGQMPYRWPVGLGVVAVYFVAIELIRQKWQGADTIVDTGFVALGASAPLVSLREVTIYPRPLLEANPVEAIVSLACIVAALAIYVYPRIRRKMEGGQ